MLKIGVDIGGTTVKGALFSDERIVKEASSATGNSRETIFHSLFSVIDDLGDAEFIGVASAGNIDNVTGKCVYATDNLKGWTGADIKGAVERRYGVPCAADNDAVCALIAEMNVLKCRDAVMLTIGTGVGGACCLDGKVVRGKNFDAARWGHLRIFPDGRQCNCGKRGCAETYLSATALLSEGRKVIGEIDDCKAIFELARSGDKRISAVIGQFGEALNILIDAVNTAVAPEYVIIGGGVSASRDVIERLIDKRYDNVVFARLGNRAGVTGAALLCGGADGSGII